MWMFLLTMAYRMLATFFTEISLEAWGIVLKIFTLGFRKWQCLWWDRVLEFRLHQYQLARHTETTCWICFLPCCTCLLFSVLGILTLLGLACMNSFPMCIQINPCSLCYHLQLTAWQWAIETCLPHTCLSWRVLEHLPSLHGKHDIHRLPCLWQSTVDTLGTYMVLMHR